MLQIGRRCRRYLATVAGGNRRRCQRTGRIRSSAASDGLVRLAAAWRRSLQQRRWFCMIQMGIQLQ